MLTPFRIEGWPALMTLELACRYLSLEPARFRALAERNRILPVEVDDEGVLWGRADLDRLVKHLPAARESLGEGARPRPVILDQASWTKLQMQLP